MGAIGFGAVGVKAQGVIAQLKATGFGDCALPLFDFRIDKLFDMPTVQANQVVVVITFVELINGFARLKVAAAEQTGLLELREHAIHRRQAHIGIGQNQLLVDFFCAQMNPLSLLKEIEDFDPGSGDAKSSVFEVCGGGHGIGFFEAGSDG
jgi:hypothetical protein